MKNKPLILASASPRRVMLLAQVGITPDQTIPADIDETPRKAELPRIYAARVAREKCNVIAAQHKDSVVLAADTVVACGRRILPKAEDARSAEFCLRTLSGRRHRVYTAVCIIAGGREYEVTVMSTLRFARLSDADIAAYVAGNEWEGKAGGYAIQGSAQTFIAWMSGSHSNIIGLPLEETVKLLKQVGAA